MGKIGEKSIWKEREMNTFPSLSIYFFSHFNLCGVSTKLDKYISMLFSYFGLISIFLVWMGENWFA